MDTDVQVSVRLFTREGHLSELTINRHLGGELGGAEAAAVASHLATCAACAAALSSVEEADAAFRAKGPPAWLPAPAPAVKDAEVRREAPVVELAPRRRRVWVAWVGVALAAAAGVALVMGVEGVREGLGLNSGLVAPGVGEGGVAPDPLDEVRIKGRALTLEVYANDAVDGTRPVGTGEEVYPGERVGFRIAPKRSGYAMILGIDDRGHDYLCWPQSASEAVAVEAAPEGMTVNAAMKLDSVLGRERVVAVLCAEPFTYSEVAATLKESAGAAPGKLPPLRAGCEQHEVVLVKAGRGGGP